MVPDLYQPHDLGWLVAPLAILAGAFLVRIFIIFHDCGHGSYFKSRWANDLAGFLTGVLTFTPYYHWRWEHNLHHASSGHLDKRGVGDIWTLTVQEYLEASRWKRFAYRLARNPFLLFVIAPTYLFLFRQRLPARTALGLCDEPRSPRDGHRLEPGFRGDALRNHSIDHPDGGGRPGRVALLCAAPVRGRVLGTRRRLGLHGSGAPGQLLLQAPENSPVVLGQHRLPPHPPFEFPHSHYNLERCHRADPLFKQVRPVTLLSSFKSLTFRLWDESERRLVSFRHLRKLRRQRKQDVPS